MVGEKRLSSPCSLLLLGNCVASEATGRIFLGRSVASMILHVHLIHGVDHVVGGELVRCSVIGC